MNYIERFNAIMNYQPYDKLPIVHFGYWKETVMKWKQEGHITQEELQPYLDHPFVYYGDPAETSIADKLGFDHCYHDIVYTMYGPFPPFERTVIGITEDGFEKVINKNGAIELRRGEAGSIPMEIDHLLKDRESWENQIKCKMQYSPERTAYTINQFGAHYADLRNTKEVPIGIHCGSIYGKLRDMMGLEGISYLYADDEDLLIEMIENQGDLCYENTKALLETGFPFDFGHFWEDIACKNGPLVPLDIFETHAGKQYRRITDLLHRYGIELISVDCDGCVDRLIPTWLDNGINIMFPIEVGTWGSSIAPWRKKYGKELRGVGGMRKQLFAQDYKAIDAEIERLKPLIELGGYIPCPDHLISPDAIWENVQYYCEKMHNTFAK